MRMTKTPCDVAAAELTIAGALAELEEARKTALSRGQTAAAVSATLAKVKLAGLTSEQDASGATTVPAPKMSLSDAARRITFLLALAAREKAMDGRGDR